MLVSGRVIRCQHQKTWGGFVPTTFSMNIFNQKGAYGKQDQKIKTKSTQQEMLGKCFPKDPKNMSRFNNPNMSRWNEIHMGIQTPHPNLAPNLTTKSRHQTAGRSTGDVGVGSCLVMVGGLHFPSSVTQLRVAVLSQNGYWGVGDIEERTYFEDIGMKSGHTQRWFLQKRQGRAMNGKPFSGRGPILQMFFFHDSLFACPKNWAWKVVFHDFCKAGSRPGSRWVNLRRVVWRCCCRRFSRHPHIA